MKALERAIRNGIEIFVADDDGERFATSASHVDHLHRVAAYDCTCEAALAGDPVCQHWAALRYILGWIAPDDTTTEMPATIDCAVCHGRGWSDFQTNGGRTFPEPVACRRCAGTGQMPGRIRTLAPAPALAAD
jgi:hypothetical protein